LLTAALIGGCSAQRIDPLAAGLGAEVWPKPPDAARVRYLGRLTGSEDFGHQASAGRFWRELVRGPEAPSMMATPADVAVSTDAQRVAVADPNGPCVHVFDLVNRSYARVEGDADDGLESPVGVAAVDGSWWVTDSKRAAIAVVSGSKLVRWIGRGAFVRPAGLAWSATNRRCYVTDAGRHAVVVLDQSGRVVGQFGSRGSETGQFNFPSHIAAGADGQIVVADSLNFRVQRFDAGGSPMGAFGHKGDAAGDMALPKGVALDQAGNIWVADARFENIQAFTPQGQLLMAMGGEGTASGRFWLPNGITIDRRQRLWVADSYNRRVQVFELLP